VGLVAGVMDFLRTPEDTRVDAARHAELVASVEAGTVLALGYQVGACTGCGSRLALWTEGRCLRCHEDHVWAEGNRAWCAWVHRAAAGRG
jgi:hypothetical protein